VIVPTRDRPAQLTDCLDALARLEYPGGLLEIVVVDDGGDADLAAVFERADSGPEMRLLRQEHRGPAAARNLGAGDAQGAVLAFTDDDCLPEPAWLRAMADAVAAAPAGAAVGGRTVNALGGNPYASASQHIQDLVYEHFNADHTEARFFASNNLAVPREAFEELGGFDAERFPFASEDRDLCDRWRASGRALHYAPAAVVLHAHELDLAGFVRQHAAYGRGAARYQRARAARRTGRMRDDASFHVNASLWLRTARLRPRRRAAGTAALLAVWQAANAAGYLLERAAMART
jgi:GT2 family glycosyltransferase